MTLEKGALHAALEDYARSGVTPLHMPGHKRNPALPDALPWAMDITEIDDFDNLHGAQGLLKDAMARAAALYRARRTFFLVNGSTCGLLAAVRALTKRGETVLVARGSHRALYHALEICGLNARYLMPEVDPETGITGSIAPETVERALDDAPNARLCVITSPTYEGVTSDIGAISDILHARGAVLLVDEAHGAHLGLSDHFPESAVRLGADVVVQSLHKTMASLTQTALLHVLTARADAGEVARQLSVFETSSPSYVLMASIDDCVATMARSGEALLAAYRARLERFYGLVKPLRHLKMLGGSRAFYDRDPGKIVVTTGHAGIDGYQLIQRLRAKGFELEMASEGYALAMTGLGDAEDALDGFARALLEIDLGLTDHPPAPPAPPLFAPRAALTIEEALSREGRMVPVQEAANRVAREYLWAYPPGVPLLVPGEVVDEGVLRLALGRRLVSTRGGWPHTLDVLNHDQID